MPHRPSLDTRPRAWLLRKIALARHLVRVLPEVRPSLRALEAALARRDAEGC